jgi:hypothetical protein
MDLHALPCSLRYAPKQNAICSLIESSGVYFFDHHDKNQNPKLPCQQSLSKQRRLFSFSFPLTELF